MPQAALAGVTGCKDSLNVLVKFPLGQRGGSADGSVGQMSAKGLASAYEICHPG